MCLPDVAVVLLTRIAVCRDGEYHQAADCHAEGWVRDGRSEGGRFRAGRDAGTRTRGIRPGEKQRRATLAVRRFKVLSSRPRKQGSGAEPCRPGFPLSRE